MITQYVDLPPTYTDEKGLPFAKDDLETAEVVSIFGPHVSTTAANRLLWILHGRRVAGTLDDPSLRVNTMMFTAEQRKLALNYLRSRVPVDEVANAGLRAEDELAALDNGNAEEADQTEQSSSGSGYTTKLKLYHSSDTQPAAKRDSVYGTSALDAIRAYNQAKWDAKRQQQEEEQKKREEEARSGVAGPVQLWMGLQVPAASPKMQEYVRRASGLTAPPEMSKWQRLLPSAAFALGLCGLCLAFAEFYRPPQRADRLWPDIPPAAATVGAIMLANVAGWVMWKIPPLWPLLNRYFLVVPATPRVTALLGTFFSHQSLTHLLHNMAVLWFLGVRLHDDIGRGPFLATYCASGAVGFLGTMTWAVLGNKLHLASIGASGAIYGVGAAYLWLHRFDHFKILGLPPPPSEGIQGLSFLALAAAVEIGGYFTARRFEIDITAHLVGMGVGVVSAYLVERRRLARLRQLEARAEHARQNSRTSNTSDGDVAEC